MMSFRKTLHYIFKRRRITAVDYKEFELEDFLANEEFVKWALEPTPELDVFWQKWLDAHAEKREAALQAKNIVRNTKFKFTPTSQEQYNKVLENILRGDYSGSHQYVSHRDNNNKKDTNSGKFLFLKLAAAILVLAVSSYLFFTFAPTKQKEQLDQVQWVSKENPAGQKSSFTLPDGTFVSLNSESRLVYPSRFDSIRGVTLEGEAFFEVAFNKDMPFVVEAEGIATKALGTSFNVRAFSDEHDVTVALSSGKVVVSKHDLQEIREVYLAPGEMAAYNKEQRELSVSGFSTDYILWKDGILSFQKAELDDFIKIVERWYGVEVEIVGAPEVEWKYNGRFKNVTLENLLKSISFAQDINYKIKKDSVQLIFN